MFAAGPAAQQAHPPSLRNDRPGEPLRRRAVVETSARQKAQGSMITAAESKAVGTAAVEIGVPSPLST